MTKISGIFKEYEAEDEEWINMTGMMSTKEGGDRNEARNAGILQ